jgi:hypothetical protein
MTKLNDTQRRALRFLAGSRPGCTQALLLAHGISGDVLDALVLQRMAKAQPRRRRVGSREKTVVWVEITKAGLHALAE